MPKNNLFSCEESLCLECSCLPKDKNENCIKELKCGHGLVVTLRTIMPEVYELKPK